MAFRFFADLPIASMLILIASVVFAPAVVAIILAGWGAVTVIPIASVFLVRVPAFGLFIVLMLLFRRRYPDWIWNFVENYVQFTTRCWAYFLLLTDRYPSFERDQTAVKLTVATPDPSKLSRWLPLVKWIMVIPHLIVLTVLAIAAVLTTFVAWAAILIKGEHPKPLFKFVVGVERWWFRVIFYAFWLSTDKYPPFSLK